MAPKTVTLGRLQNLKPARQNEVENLNPDWWMNRCSITLVLLGPAKTRGSGAYVSQEPDFSAAINFFDQIDFLSFPKLFIFMIRAAAVRK